LPKFLDHFVERDESLPKKKCMEVVNGTFDYKAEEQMLQSMRDAKSKWERAGGPLRKKELDL
jgi:hypothetical protein